MPSLIVPSPTFSHPFPPLRPAPTPPSHSNPFTPSAYQKAQALAQVRASYRATLPNLSFAAPKDISLYQSNGQLENSVEAGMVVSEQA